MVIFSEIPFDCENSVLVHFCFSLVSELVETQTTKWTRPHAPVVSNPVYQLFRCGICVPRYTKDRITKYVQAKKIRSRLYKQILNRFSTSRKR